MISRASASSITSSGIWRCAYRRCASDRTSIATCAACACRNALINPSCTKGSSLAEWAALRGIDREDVLAIGDNHNDLEMLTFAGIPVVMANCVAELKAFGWHETASNDHDGVAAAIEHFALREAPSCA